MKGPKYKKFGTKAEAEAFVKSGWKTSKVAQSTAAQEAKVKQDEDGPALKKAKISGEVPSRKRVARVYTDGSSLGNGQKGAMAGVGVFFGVNDPR